MSPSLDLQIDGRIFGYNAQTPDELIVYSLKGMPYMWVI